ncbi:hypothetical protein CEUSTIGMA_g5578.t1 [Chlamydomonas eustigma]|uniref:SET domain-containing protein n=1 Tax=Chlamydomonas eustigma TaxID=1157962 RepID=A0A250X513_9CHLO|nr:hypothetical protein CEUSTIGMA_g5578.t1 [Chlamydomonas eustigma]|eukprot:GAX78136.1 hypothetical protein CEUSTIGMA_g5578.t1 [Chlamydomonas eustigma]
MSSSISFKPRLCHVALERPLRRSRPACKASLLQDLVEKFVNSKSSASEEKCPEAVAWEEWIQLRGAPRQQLTLRQCGVEGRGLVAKERIRQGTKLLQLPENFLISSELALKESSLLKAMQRLPEQSATIQGLPEWTLMALYLVELRHWSAATQGATSQGPGIEQPSTSDESALHDVNGRGDGTGQRSWHQYISVLPALPGSLLDWPPQQVDQLLAGSPLRRKAADIAEAARKSWAEVQPLVREAEQERLVPMKLVTESTFKWALGILLTRSVLVRIQGVEKQVLIPWADFLNHDVSVTSYIQWDDQTRSIVLVTDREYQEGQQVYVSYGQRSSGDIMLSYGFCPAPTFNPNQAYDMRVELNPKDSFLKAKEAALLEMGMSRSMSFPLRIDGFPKELVNYLAFKLYAPAQDSEIGDVARQIFLEGKLVVKGQDLRLLALSELRGECRRALREFPVSAEEDKASASSLASLSSQQGTPASQEILRLKVRKGMCAEIRLRERQILQRSDFIIGGQLKLRS